MQGMVRTWVTHVSAGNIAIGAVIGFVLGAASAGEQATGAQPATVQAEQVTVTETVTEPAGAQRFADLRAEVADERDRLAELADELRDRDHALDVRTRKLARRADRLDARADEPATRPGATGATVAAAEDAPTHFDNCDAAIAAGAAPVRVGDAGYGPHLDRDGDGVACES